jgi:hypothetical protein
LQAHASISLLPAPVRRVDHTGLALLPEMINVTDRIDPAAKQRLLRPKAANN